MAKRLTDEEIMDYTYNKVFGDLDGLRSGSMFSEDKGATEGAVPDAGTAGLEGIDITIKPRMLATAEGDKPEEEDEEDRLKGISKMSPLMSQLHGDR